jgi:methylphosphotriester-DNA--protein-cysteine methyltransferase
MTNVVINDCCVFCKASLNLWYATCPGKRVPCTCEEASAHWKMVAEIEKEMEKEELQRERETIFEKARLEKEYFDKLFEENFF